MLTKGKFLELLKAVDPDPNFLVTIVKECFKMLPDAASWRLAHQLYMNYYYDGPIFKIKSLLTGEEILFPNEDAVLTYLVKLGYDTDMKHIRSAFSRGLQDYCSHSFYKASGDNKKEITYFE